MGEIQIESRGLRSQLASQSEEIERILRKHQEGLDRVASGVESIHREQQELAKTFRSLAGLLKGLFFAVLFLLVSLTVLSALILFRMSHVYFFWPCASRAFFDCFGNVYNDISDSSSYRIRECVTRDSLSQLPVVSCEV